MRPEHSPPTSPAASLHAHDPFDMAALVLPHLAYPCLIHMPPASRQVTLVGTKEGNGNMRQQANIKLRFNRNPVIGDKFASRHGQKGVLSIRWPDVDMPYAAATGVNVCGERGVGRVRTG